jgi:hypothetical protein
MSMTKSALTLADLQYKALAGGDVARIVANGTVNIFVGRCVLLAVYCADAGTGWTVTFYDDDDGTDNEVHQFLTAGGKGRTEVNVPLSTGLRYVASGTAGILVVTYMPLEA